MKLMVLLLLAFSALGYSGSAQPNSIEVASLNFTYPHGPDFICSDFEQWELSAYDNKTFTVGVVVTDLHPNVDTLVWVAEAEEVVPIDISVEMRERLITSNASVDKAEFAQINTSIGATWSAARAPRKSGGYDFVAILVFNDGQRTGMIIIDERRCDDCRGDWDDFNATLAQFEFTEWHNCRFEDALPASSVLFSEYVYKKNSYG